MSKEKVEIVRRAYEAFDRACHDTARLGTGVVERDFAHVWTVTAASLVRLQVFKTTEEALEAAGLQGQGLD
jgi:hypothetical protein